MRQWLFVSVVLLWSLAAALGQQEFKVYPTSESVAEGPNVNVLVIKTDHERFELRSPKNYSSAVHQSDQSIVFTSETGSTVITVQMSTNYAGGLPKMEDLRDLVAKRYSSASLVKTSTAFTSCGTGPLFDLFQPAGNSTLRIRVAYISFAEGSFEFTLSCDIKDYDTSHLTFGLLLNSFHQQEEPAKKNP